MTKHFGFSATLFLGALVLLSACQSDGIEDYLEANKSSFAPPDQSWHQGPEVDLDGQGPARYVPDLLRHFDAERAMETVRLVDGYYRAPGNDGYNVVLDHLRARLQVAGFDGSDARLELQEIRTPLTEPAWTPLAGLVSLRDSSGAQVVLHRFDKPGEHDRTMLPVGAPSCDVSGPLCFSLEDLRPGDILITKASLGQVGGRAKQRGAVAVLSSSLMPFNVDPTGAERHMNALQYTSIPPNLGLPAAQISPMSHLRLESAGAGATVRLLARTRSEKGATLRTLVATIYGTDYGSGEVDECVASAAHVQEPGANDNASGVGGLLEGAVALVGALKAEAIEWPRRSLVLVWGDEYGQTETWIADTKFKPVAGISSDMVGNSAVATGARALLERGPDPGALLPLLPDEHTPWGAGTVEASDLNPNGLAVIARCALVDVGLAEGEWASADHPWEGGSDHDVFIDLGIPAVLFWHFTDFAYHTSLDRIDMVDPSEIKRTEVAVLATMLAIADPRPTDLRRYVTSNELERRLRVDAAMAAGEADHAEAWNQWCKGAAAWLRAECLNIPIEEATLPAK